MLCTGLQSMHPMCDVVNRQSTSVRSSASLKTRLVEQASEELSQECSGLSFLLYIASTSFKVVGKSF